MEANKKVLIIDKAIDRKNKISALKQAGYSVFPALKLQEARTRCRPGAYDLVVVNALDEMQEAVSFCDMLSDRSPAQPVLLITGSDAPHPGRHYVVQDDVDVLVSKVGALLGRKAAAAAPEAEEARATA